MDVFGCIYITIAFTISSSKGASPVWTNLEATVSLNENTPVGTSIYFLQATDADVGGTLNYSQHSSLGNFELSGQEVTTKFIPDYESGLETYSILFSVSDGTTTSTSTLTVVIADVNEYNPVLSSPINGNVDEEQPIGTVVTVDFTANDSDKNSALQYSLSANTYFNIRASSGQIYTKVVFDRDTLSSSDISLTLTVYDGDPGTAGTRSSTAALTISIIDINDNTPVFASPFYIGTVAENGTSGTSVISISATDADDGVNKQFSLSIESGDTSSRFSITGNDIVTTSTPIDYETDTSFTLIVTATDQGSTQRTGSTTVHVSVTGVNEFSPSWSSFTPVWISATTDYNLLENAAIGTTVVTISAEDLDDGTDGTITFEVVSITTSSGSGSTTGLFRVNSVTGALSTIGTFDFENADDVMYYDIIVKAKDGGAKSIQRTVRVGLVDYNDNVPVFNPSTSTVSIPETSSTGSSVVLFSVTDEDQTSVFTFTIVSGNDDDYFELNSSVTNLLQLKSIIDLDSPTLASDTYNLQITAKDGGSPELTGTTYVTVSVSSVNEYQPTFTTCSNDMNVSISESASMGSTLTSVAATDNDFGNDGEIEYSIESGNTNDTFRVISSSGEIVLTKALDYETVTLYVLHIQAKDGGTSPMSSTCTLSIILTDVNDNDPSCSTVSAISIVETASIGETITILSCFDADNATLSYTLNLNEFSVNSSGVITLAEAMDYDSGAQSYSFDVVVSDGSRSTTVGIVISLTAVNEYTPTFTNETVSFNEDIALGTTISMFTASDDDSSPHAITSYAISSVSNGGFDWFSIDESSANIRLTRKLDFDVMSTKEYEIIVVATDGGGLKGTGTVTVSVIDVNDNTPSCQPSLHVLSIPENTSPSAIVADLNCTDADSGMYGNLSYVFSQTPETEFALEEGTTVSINLTGSLDYESIRSYSLTVVVVDGGNPVLSTSVVLDIAVTDVNEGGPTFSGTYSLSLFENSSIGSHVLTVTANDPDSSDSSFGKLFYWILSGDDDNKFSIDSSTGEIVVTGELDRETVESYSLVVQAIEQIGANSASTTVNITLLDVNDNIPVCTFMTFSTAILESASPGTILQALNCSDIDSDEYANLTYSLLSGDNNVLEITSSALTLKSTVDFESGITSYDVIIEGSDGTYAVNVTGTVAVTEVNEASPVFSSGLYLVNISENATIGTTVLSVSSTDEDTSDVLTYSFLVQSTHFSIDSRNGDIILRKQLDRETTPTYSIDVTVTDGTNINTSKIDVTVLDINDNAPIFNPVAYIGRVLEDDLEGSSVVVTVIATDADDVETESNGEIQYSIIEGDPSNDFQINASTGELTTRKQLDYETAQSYSLVIKAADRSGDTSSLSASAFVTVLVTNVNEFNPTFNDTYSAIISEEASIGTSVTTVFAIDADSSDDGDVYYSCIHSKFYIDSDSGVLYIKDNLDYETETSYSIEVVATDRGTPARNTTTNVLINITDVNDNSPQCFPSSYSSVQREDITNGTSVSALLCTDSDSGSNSNMSYTIDSVNAISGSALFSVDSSGIVTTQSNLNYETETLHSIRIFVKDGGSPQKTATVSVNVAVSDVNEHTPVFSQTTYSISVSETLTVGSVVLNLTATDLDTEDSIYYYLNLTNQDFDVDYTSGQVKIKSPLDIETTASYSLVVIALDSGTVDVSRSSSATVVITILDENEKPPIFSQSLYILSVSENTAIATSLLTVNATDLDNDIFTFTIYSGNNLGIFNINATTGQLDLGSNLDFENTTKHTLMLKAEDSRGLSSTATIEIIVTGYNEFSPVFDLGHSSTITIPENTTIGTNILTFVVKDEDSGNDGIVSYNVNATSSEFSIESSTGVLKTTESLDRERTSQYIIYILAIDVGISPNSFTSTHSLTITISDVNDVTPTCTPNILTHVMSESTNISTNLLQIMCTDADDDPDSLNNQTMFAISNGNVANAFDLNNSTGFLTLQNVLDREVAAEYILTVIVSDSGSPVLSTTVSIFITVTDENDNSPIFSNDTYEFVVNENTAVSSVVGQVIASDLDSGAAGTVSFSIIDGNEEGKFGIDSVSGDIKILHALDAESTTIYNLTVNGKDSGFLIQTSSAYVVITITDFNDNMPTCQQSLYSLTIAENSTYGYEVLQLICSDEDSSSVLSYSFVNTFDEFSIDSLNGTITVGNQSLDTESVQSFTLLINVTDQKYHTIVTLYVTVTDINEHTPTFYPPGPYSITISEDFPIAGTIYTVSAIDSDFSNGSLSYSIASGIVGSEITISSDTGVIQLRQTLNSEVQSSYVLGLEVTDGVFTSSTNLTISVSDVNDNFPTCNENVISLTFNENISIDTTLFTPSCVDNDITNSSLVFEIVSGNGEENIEINATTGELSLNESLDYETTSNYELTVRVTDAGIPSLSTEYKIYLSVLPVNEFEPIFGSSNYDITVSENEELNSHVILVNASDSDSGLSHGSISYSIISGDSSGYFSIDSTGQIKLSRLLDREAVDFYSLIVTAKDGNTGSTDSKTSTAYVNITILDVNDNYPQFSQTFYSVSIYESAVVGAIVTTLSATDDDIDENGLAGLHYSIVSGNTGNTFTITNNKVVLVNDIDRESTANFKLLLMVQDNGTTMLSDNAYLNVEILAVNEFTPNFANDSNTLIVKETIPIGTVLHTFSATDNDTGNYGVVRYYIVGNITYSEFLLDEYTGQLTVWSALDYDTSPTEYNITVQAIDTGYNESDSKWDFMWLNVILSDENDHSPTFSQNVYTIFIFENMTIGYSIGSVSATDDDSGENGVFVYSIVSGDGSVIFAINETTGDITTLTDIDYETKTLYSVVVEAKDNGSINLSSRCLVKVLVNDLNDNAPTFQPEDFAVNILENVTIGTVVSSMLATDEDSSVSGNNVFTYSLESDTFAIDSSGVITTTLNLDRENISSYTLNITAVDQGNPPMTGTATLTVLLDDVNDNSPTIYGDYQLTVSENAGINTVITTINATDADSGVNSDLTFNIVNGNTNDDFKIDDKMGLIQVAKSLDRERTSVYYLSVDVIDGGSPERLSSVNISITISDINDNIPVFTSNTFVFSIPENVTVGYEVGTVTATDADTEVNGEILYRIPIFWTGINSHFTINESTGIISTNAKLDRETHEQYKILCRILDKGSPAFTNAVNITIDITDINDNDPLLNSTTYSASFPENQAIGTYILSVFVTDLDIDENQEVTLAIDTTTTDGQIADTYIDINSTTHTLSVKQNIDREVTETFQFILIATDGGSPSRSTNASISLIIEDENDNSPVFSSQFYNTEIPYNDNCHVSVGRVTATDADFNDTITFFLADMNYSNIFSMNQTSGYISLLTSPLDTTSYVLNVLASDTALNNGTSIVRVDSFESESTMVTVTMGMSKNSFESLEETFINQIDDVIRVNYTTSKTRRRCLKETSESTIDVAIYTIEDNSTNYYDNIGINKTFLEATTLKSLLTFSNGSVALVGVLWDQFNISSITSFTASSSLVSTGSTDTNWIETTTGIAVLSTIGVLIAALTIGIILVKILRSSRVKSQDELIKEKRKAFKVEEKDLEKPAEIKKQTMQVEDDYFEKEESVSHDDHQSRTGTARTQKYQSRVGTRQTDANRRSRTGTRQSMKKSVDIQKQKMLVNVPSGLKDKALDEIDKSKLPPPVIVRGPMPKIDKNTHYKENDLWSDKFGLLPNVIHHHPPMHHHLEGNRADRPQIIRVYDQVSKQMIEYDTKAPKGGLVKTKK